MYSFNKPPTTTAITDGEEVKALLYVHSLTFFRLLMCRVEEVFFSNFILFTFVKESKLETVNKIVVST